MFYSALAHSVASSLLAERSTMAHRRACSFRSSGYLFLVATPETAIPRVRGQGRRKVFSCRAIVPRRASKADRKVHEPWLDNSNHVRRACRGIDQLAQSVDLP